MQEFIKLLSENAPLVHFKELLQKFCHLLQEKNFEGDYLLHWAVRFNRLDVMQLLIEHKVDIDAQNKLQQTPLYIAANLNHLDAARLLLEKGAKQVADNQKSTPLHLAVSNQRTAMIELLCKYSIDLEARDRSGSTPLNIALMKKNNDANIILLLKNGAQEKNAYPDKEQLDDIYHYIYVLGPIFRNDLKQKQALFDEFNKGSFIPRLKKPKMVRSQYVGDSYNIDGTTIVSNIFVESRGPHLDMSDVITDNDLGTLYESEAEGMINYMASLNDDSVVTNSVTGLLKIWNLKTRMQTPLGNIKGVTCVIKLHDGRVVSGTYDGKICVWDEETRRCLKTLTATVKHGFVTKISECSDDRIMSRSLSGNIYLWDLNSGKCLEILTSHEILSAREKYLTSITLLSGGRVVVEQHDHRLMIWDITARNAVQFLTGNNNFRSAQELKGNKLVSWRENELKVWDLTTGKCLHQSVIAENESIKTVTELSDDRLMIRTCREYEQTIKFWEYSLLCLTSIEREQIIAVYDQYLESRFKDLQSIMCFSSEADQLNAIDDVRLIFLHYVIIDEKNGYLKQAKYFQRLGRYDLTYEIYKNHAEQIGKEFADIEIAGMILAGHLNINDDENVFPTELVLEDLQQIEGTDNEAAKQNKLAKNQAILCARATQAYKYIEAYLDKSNFARLLLSQINYFLAGKEMLLSNRSETHQVPLEWLSDSFEKFKQYYANYKPIGQDLIEIQEWLRVRRVQNSASFVSIGQDLIQFQEWLRTRRAILDKVSAIKTHTETYIPMPKIVSSDIELTEANLSLGQSLQNPNREVVADSGSSLSTLFAPAPAMGKLSPASGKLSPSASSAVSTERNPTPAMNISSPAPKREGRFGSR